MCVCDNKIQACDTASHLEAIAGLGRTTVVPKTYQGVWLQKNTPRAFSIGYVDHHSILLPCGYGVRFWSTLDACFGVRNRHRIFSLFLPHILVLSACMSCSYRRDSSARTSVSMSRSSPASVELDSTTICLSDADIMLSDDNRSTAKV